MFQASNHKDNYDIPLVLTTQLEEMPDFPYPQTLQGKKSMKSFNYSASIDWMFHDGSNKSNWKMVTKNNVFPSWKTLLYPPSCHSIPNTLLFIFWIWFATPYHCMDISILELEWGGNLYKHGRVTTLA